MTEQRNSRIALLAIVMLLSGAFLGLLVSDNASAARYDLNGFVSDNNADVSIIYWIEIQGTRKQHLHLMMDITLSRMWNLETTK